MLQLKAVSSYYNTGEYIQKALNQVNLTYQDSEFISILEPSSSGKATLLWHLVQNKRRLL